MSDFTLDTSGAIFGAARPTEPGWLDKSPMAWPDLSPFEQGYVKELFKTLWNALAEHYGEGFIGARLAFSDVAPETVAAIRKDCAAVTARYPVWASRDMAGRDMWEERQRGEWVAFGFPPLTVSIGDKGKVYARAAA